MAITDKQKKYLIAGAGAVALVLLIRAAWPKNDSSGAGFDPTGNGSTGTSNNTNFNATKVTQELFEAMKGSFSDTEEIMDILTPLTAGQFQQVITAFATKAYNTTTGNQYELLWGDGLPKEPLKVWLKTELWESQYNQLKLKFKNLNYL